MGEHSAAIGIDLGTSTSSIARLRDGRPELLPDDGGDRIIPSVVQVASDGQILVGMAAKNGAVAFHDRTAQEVKRLMGTDATVALGDQSYTPEEVYAFILRHLKDAAETQLGPDTVCDVVLSVPALFENAAREATKRAAEMAGLNVVHLINEPTAAALSYGLDRLRNEERVLVFDFGGGTLDVTVLEMFNGVLDVKTSVGDDQLGGMDVDVLLVNFFRTVFEEQHGAPLPPAADDPRIAQILKEEAEAYKKRLSDETTVMVEIPYLSPDGGIQLMLTRNRLDDLMAELLQRAMKLVDEALSRARLTLKDMDVILPIGGSSRIPLFRRVLERRWGKPIQEYDDPDEAVARGAAIAAGIEQRQFDGEDDIMILDVSPHRLGVAVLKQVGENQYIDGFFSEIVPKDAKLPAIETRDYRTLCNGRDSITIRIYEAATDGKLCRDHRLISQLPLSNIPGARDGQSVQIEFRYAMDGTLDVCAYCPGAPDARADGRFSLTAADEETSAAQKTQAKRRIDRAWDSSAEARKCAPLLEQADTLAETTSGAASASLRRTAAALREALSAGSKTEVSVQADALGELLFQLA